MASSYDPARRERGDGFSEERRRLFLVALRTGESVLTACALVGISNRTAYNHRDRDPDFARAWALARRMCGLPLQLAAYERGVEGIKEPVYVHGRLSHTRVRYSDSLLRMLMMADEPRKYGRQAGFRTERKQFEKRIDAKVAAAAAPLGAALAAAQAELEELRKLRNSCGEIVNFVNPSRKAGRAAPAPSPRGRRRGSLRLAAARRRLREAEIPFFSRSP